MSNGNKCDGKKLGDGHAGMGLAMLYKVGKQTLCKGDM